MTATDVGSEGALASPPTPTLPHPPTLEDVARLAGVSSTTASRVLNGSKRRVVGENRDRVEAAARRLGYAANASAQATARGTSAIVALLVADIADPYFGQIAAGVARGADEAGLTVTIATTDRDPDREVRLIHALRGQRPRALILAASRTAGANHPELVKALEAFTQTGGRVVALGSGARGIRTVGVDNIGGARSLGASLANRGYRQAIVLAAADGVVTSDERAAGFRSGFEAGGGTVRQVHRGTFTRESGTEMMRRALAEGITAETLVFAVSDVIALGAMTAVRAAGRTIGTDIALCGFDDIPWARDVTPTLTTVPLPLEHLGYVALRAVIDDGSDAHPSVPLPVVTVRDSTPPISAPKET